MSNRSELEAKLTALVRELRHLEGEHENLGSQISHAKDRRRELEEQIRAAD